MAKRFLEVYDDDLRRAAAARGMTTRAVVTLASLIEKETSRADERPLVSAVYHNRLRIGMGLQCDPTVIYALQRAGRWNGNLTREGLQFDSPYNTYKYAGPAARPDCRAGPRLDRGRGAAGRRRSISTSSAATTDRTFSPTTLADHNRNVQEFQVSTSATAAPPEPEGRGRRSPGADGVGRFGVNAGRGGCVNISVTR